MTGCYAFFKSEKELNGEREAYEHWMPLLLVFLVMTTNKIDQFHFFVRVLPCYETTKFSSIQTKRTMDMLERLFDARAFAFLFLPKAYFEKVTLHH